MKQRFLLFFVMTAFITTSQAQKRNRSSVPNTTGYAITAIEKGGRSWKEVRQVDAATGETVKTIYDSKQEAEALNARTGKPILKKDQTAEKSLTRTYTTTVAPAAPGKKVMNLDQELDKANGDHSKTYTHTVIIMRNHTVGGTDKPFATNSA
ncbi:MAG TPA: hypothetical protein VMZ03_01080, partial [Chitinophagaceae bacterium]|nr:hypothetical protein [Chitinophagaceae bacterium]